MIMDAATLARLGVAIIALFPAVAAYLLMESAGESAERSWNGYARPLLILVASLGATFTQVFIYRYLGGLEPRDQWFRVASTVQYAVVLAIILLAVFRSMDELRSKLVYPIIDFFIEVASTDQARYAIVFVILGPIISMFVQYLMLVPFAVVFHDQPLAPLNRILPNVPIGVAALVLFALLTGIAGIKLVWPFTLAVGILLSFDETWGLSSKLARVSGCAPRLVRTTIAFFVGAIAGYLWLVMINAQWNLWPESIFTSSIVNGGPQLGELISTVFGAGVSSATCPRLASLLGKYADARL